MFTLNLVTPEKKLVAGAEIEEVFVPAFRGELNILPGHAPLMTTLSTGVLRYRFKGETVVHPVAISWGYCQVSPTGVNILAETAERPEEIDLDRVKIALTKASERLASVDLNEADLAKFQNKVGRAQVRQEVASSGPKSTH
ncbi:MAG: ATP synthase F1 subunit epsilon [Bdellovibrionaceae bacterium]|nr:ATP synthase F1 subunit epsilon [Pseudobdellovibrionaceae bacterium]